MLAHAQALLTSDAAGATEYIDADLRDTSTILDRAQKLLDFSQPVAVTLIALVHAIPDTDDPHAIVARLTDAVPSGSYLALSHLAADLLGQEVEDNLRAVGTRVATAQQFAARDRAQVERFFTGLDLVEPGMVRVEEWRSEPAEAAAGRSSLWCARWAASAEPPGLRYCCHPGYPRPHRRGTGAA